MQGSASLVNEDQDALLTSIKEAANVLNSSQKRALLSWLRHEVGPSH